MRASPPNHLTLGVSTMNVSLEPLSLDHLDGVMSWVNDPEVTFYFASHGKEFSRDEEADYLERLIASEDNFTYSVFADGVYVGQVALAQIYWPARHARLSTMLARSAWGKGIAFQAEVQLFKKAFLGLDLHKVWAIIRSDNPKGLYRCSKLGMRCEGILRDEYFAQGRYYDMVRFGCLHEDFARAMTRL